MLKDYHQTGRQASFRTRHGQGNRIWNFSSIFSECPDLPAVFESEKGGLRNPRSAFSNQPLGLFFL